MSTENLPYGPGGDGAGKLGLFLAVSLAIHGSLAVLAMTSGPALKLLAEKTRATEPIYVDVIELPPEHPSNKGPQKGIRRYADRTNVVEEETIPGPADAVVVPGSPGVSPKTPSARPAAPAGSIKAAPDAGPPEARAPDNIAVGPVEAPPSPASEWAGTKPEKASPGAAAGPARPNLLLSEEKLAELAKSYEKESPAGEKGKTLQLNTTELKYQKYLINMKDRIEFYWEYPLLAVQNGWQGKLHVDFSIKSDGTVGAIVLKKSSGHPVLDDAARTALKLAAPFPPFPENFSIEEINIKGQFEYNLRYAPAQPVR